MNKKTWIVITSILLVPVFVSAHVKWFAKPSGIVRSYEITDSWVIAWIIFSVLLVLFGIFLEKRINPPKVLVKNLPKIIPIIESLSGIGFGIALIIFSIKGFIFAPNLPAEGDLGIFMLVLQAVSGLTMLFGYYERVGALILLVLFTISVKIHGVEMIDALEMLGFSLYLFIIDRPKWSIKKTTIFQKTANTLSVYSLPILRVFTGLNLIALGFTEKILAPSLAQSFLEHYHWNFMQALGLSIFTNYWFAFSAGVVEVLFGVFLVLGLVTRLTTIILAIFLGTTLVLLGPVELIGHLPHFSIAIVFLVMGSGSRFKLINK